MFFILLLFYAKHRKQANMTAPMTYTGKNSAFLLGYKEERQAYTSAADFTEV